MSELAKVGTGIRGLDEMTSGGFPQGRPTLVCGGAGCGKTVLGLQFLVRGALDADESGVFVAFEETTADLATNVTAFGWDLEALIEQRKLAVEHVFLERATIQEAGAFDLEALFIRIGAAIDRVGAKRVVIDTLEVIFSAFHDHTTLRSELSRLFRWLKDRGVTAVVTAERGDGQLTRHGLEEYVSDCVVVLDHRVTHEISTRRLRVVKYRGSTHSTDETPFAIDSDGIRVLPLRSLGLAHEAPNERLSTGIARLDTMLGGSGYYRGGSVLITGTPGSGKTTIAAAFVAAACERGERAMLFAFEESPKQLIRNLLSVGVDLAPHVASGLLRIDARRPSSEGLEAHLAGIMHGVEEFGPSVVAADPVSAFQTSEGGTEAMLTRLIDWLKAKIITAVYTSVTRDDEETLGVSSLIDSWISLAAEESNGERNRTLRVIKARGTGHSNQVRELIISDDGIDLLDVYAGSGAMVLGTARRALEAQETAAAVERSGRMRIRRQQVQRRRAELEASIAALQAELEAETMLAELEERAGAEEQAGREATRDALERARGADAVIRP